MAKNNSELGEFSFIEKITENFEIKNSESLLREYVKRFPTEITVTQALSILKEIA